MRINSSQEIGRTRGPKFRLPFWKRVIDVTGAATLLLAASPLMLAVAAVIRWRMGSPVIFRQVRPGLGERPFQMLKFRTMNDRRNPDGTLAPDRERLTRLGRWLRASSLDELPQMVNILRGDMSFVGPRPLLMEYLAHYTPRERARHSVRPGITGLAQVCGRNILSWDERLELDAQYVERLSLGLDMWIVWRTALAVITASGVSVDSAEAEGNLVQIRRARNGASGKQ
mgnify:CR=1 FL=1